MHALWFSPGFFSPTRSRLGTERRTEGEMWLVLIGPSWAGGWEKLGTEQSAAAVYEELCRILFGSV